MKHLKLTFPQFEEGADPNNWVRGCKEYFDIYEISEVKKVSIAALHMHGTAKNWYKSYIVGR